VRHNREKHDGKRKGFKREKKCTEKYKKKRREVYQMRTDEEGAASRREQDITKN